MDGWSATCIVVFAACCWQLAKKVLSKRPEQPTVLDIKSVCMRPRWLRTDFVKQLFPDDDQIAPSLVGGRIEVVAFGPRGESRAVVYKNLAGRWDVKFLRDDDYEFKRALNTPMFEDESVARRWVEENWLDILDRWSRPVQRTTV